MDFEFEKTLKIAVAFSALSAAGVATDYFLCRDYRPDPDANPVVGIVNGVVANSAASACRLIPWR